MADGPSPCEGGKAAHLLTGERVVTVLSTGLQCSAFLDVRLDGTPSTAMSGPVAQAAAVSETTVRKNVFELEADEAHGIAIPPATTPPIARAALQLLLVKGLQIISMPS